MNLFNKIKTKGLFIQIIIVFGVVFALINILGGSKQVEAIILPVTVNVNHLDFGNVFPGEELEGDFTVTYVAEGDGINYRIIQQRKPLPEEHPEYPDGGDPEMPGYYRDLCPFLTKVSNEGEEDTENEAFVGPNDISDTWTIYFKVPAIFGNVAQPHIGGVVDANGEYGCDVSIDIIEGCVYAEICDNQIDDNCDGYTDCDDEGCLEDPACQP